MKKIAVLLITVLVSLIISIILYSYIHRVEFIQDGVETISLVHRKDFLVKSNDSINEIFIKGVNIGATVPGHFPGELAISKETYLRWFQMIYEMNANTIRVYTIMKPCFYEALAEFNSGKENPLYILHGVWVSEEKINSLLDAYASNMEIINEFKQDSKALVDIIHGNKILPERAGFASGEYKADVSRYVIGWILGIEWSPNFVIGTNDSNKELDSFSGEYLRTKNASPFEVFLADVGNDLLEYEAINYQMTRPISYTNWLTTDSLSHPGEPDPKEDKVSVNTEHIIPTEKAFAGIFASYHVYPYYPEFMNYDPKYQEWIDKDTGEKNPYKAYLKNLIDSHKMPVLIAEFGVPSSRGVTHLDIPKGYNQGGHTEIEQGEILVQLFNDIYDSNAIGALTFSWQDEWFKRTWNTMDFDLSWRRPFWSNIETNEQYFGLLGFEPGDGTYMHQTDGDISEWNEISPISINDNTTIYADSDYRYLHIMIQSSDIDWNNDTVYIPIDTIMNQGNDSWIAEDIEFDIDADFVVKINGENNSKILVDQYYDANEYFYSEVLDMIDCQTNIRTKNTGIFQPINHVLSAALVLPISNIEIPFSMYEAGNLRYGNSNPNANGYDSLSDFYFGLDFVEIRIPWLLLNVMDPSTKQIISDFNINMDTEFISQTSNGFYIGVSYKKGDEQIILQSGLYDWEEWHTMIYHERLKDSYYIVKEAYNRVE